MRSFDIWDTVMARRSMIDVHNEKDNLFPIAENVAKVQPGDIFVSDFYDGEFLKKTVPEITGLTNQMFVSLDGKYTGSIWPKLKQQFDIVEHIGDSEHSDYNLPRKQGVKSTLSVLASFTGIEKEMDNLGMHGLARVMREARLTTWHPNMRLLQLAQAQVNFPMLFAASILVHRTSPNKLLMVSRDCCLWQHVQKLVRDMSGGKYDIVYFKTSRAAIAEATPEYMTYVNRVLPGTVVDYATGPNKSILKLIQKSNHPNVPIMTIVHKPAGDRITGLLNVEPRSIHTEYMNLDKHAMYIGEHQGFNPANVDWENMPEIAVMHETFDKACSVAKYYNFSSDLCVSDNVLKQIIFNCLQRAPNYAAGFKFVESFFSVEHEETIRRLGV